MNMASGAVNDHAFLLALDLGTHLPPRDASMSPIGVDVPALPGLSLILLRASYCFDTLQHESTSKKEGGRPVTNGLEPLHM
jgi:hypothetical protein